MTVRIELVRDSDRFIALHEAWQDLWHRSGATIFQNHDCLAGWISGMQGRKEMRLLIAAAWDGEALIGAFPCAIHRRSGLRLLQWTAQLFCDYCDCLIDPGHPEILGRLWDAIWAAGGFDIVSLQQVRPDAHCRAFLDRLADQGYQLRHATRVDHCMRIDNAWPDGEAYFRSLNKKARNNHTRGKRILSELGGDASFRVIEFGEDAGPAIDTLLRLKGIWLRAADPSSALLGIDGAVQRALVDSLWQCGLAKVFLLTCGDKIAAISMNFVYASRMEAYLTSYDTAFERASPGTILIVEYARWAFERGLRHVDFLRGDEAFKLRLANAETLISSFSGARTWVGQVAVSGHRWLSRRGQPPAMATAEELDAAD